MKDGKHVVVVVVSSGEDGRIGLLRLISQGSVPKERSNRREAELQVRSHADILHIDKRLPHPEQESEELGDEVIPSSQSRLG